MTHDVLQACMHYQFKQPHLLMQALTHATYAFEHAHNTDGNYERLEFLGDAVLGLLAADILLQHMQGANEGVLSRQRASLVKRESLAHMARAWHVEDFIRLGAGQKNNSGGATKKILADTFEALAGAVYVDGGFDAVKTCFSACFLQAMQQTNNAGDFKTQLQELCHQKKLSAPLYYVLHKEGPAHALQFHCEVRIGDVAMGQGSGLSKKSASQICAMHALKYLQQERSDTDEQ